METEYKIYFKSSENMSDVNSKTIKTIITSPPYWDLKNYLIKNQIGYNENYEEYLNVEILKVAHHGSNGSSGEDFLDKVSPEYSVISVGEGNYYGHPSLRAVKRIERTGSGVFRTDMEGDIAFKIYQNGVERLFE